MRKEFYDQPRPPKTIFLSGTGVIEGSWAPVRKALKRYFPELPDGQENLAFATEIYQLRQIAAAYQGGIRMVGLSNIMDLLTIRKAFKRSMARYNDIKKEISNNLTRAMNDNQMTIRPIVSKINLEWLTGSKSHIVITTNWDLMLENYFQDSFVYHLHDDIRDFHTLYLPLEHSREPYHHIEAKGKVPKHNGRITHGNWLATGVDKLIISGLSLSPLDAEINSLLRSAITKGPIAEVIIVDPFPDEVYQRLRFHTSDSICKLKLLKPEEL